MNKILKEIISKIGAVIFDMDGVIADTEPIQMQAFRFFMDQLELVYSEEYIKSFIGISVENNMLDIQEKYSLGNDFNIKDAVAMRDKIYLDTLNSIPLQPGQGFPDLIEVLENRNIKYSLASSSSQEQVMAVLYNITQNNEKGINYLKKFNGLVVTGDDVSRRKPAPDIYQLSVSRIGMPPQVCLAIEDSPSGIQSAKSAGLFCAGLKTLQVNEELLSGSDFRIPSLSDLSSLIIMLR